jgi:hypothetical protein
MSFSPLLFLQAGYLYLTDALRLHEVMIQLGIESTTENQKMES